MKLIKNEKHQIKRLYGYEIDTRGGHLARLIAYHPLLGLPVIGIMKSDDTEVKWSVETWCGDGSYFGDKQSTAELDLNQDRLVEIYNRFGIMGPSKDKPSERRNNGFGDEVVFPNSYVGFKYDLGDGPVYVAMLDEYHVVSDDGIWFQALFNVQTKQENSFFLCDADGDLRHCLRNPHNGLWSFEEIGVDLGRIFHDITYPSLKSKEDKK